MDSPIPGCLSLWFSGYMRFDFLQRISFTSRSIFFQAVHPAEVCFRRIQRLFAPCAWWRRQVGCCDCASGRWEVEGAAAELLAARSRGLCWSAMLELGLRVGRAEGTGSVGSSPPQFFDSQHRGGKSRTAWSKERKGWKHEERWRQRHGLHFKRQQP